MALTSGTINQSVDVKSAPKRTKSEVIYDSLNRLDNIVKEFENLVLAMKAQEQTERPEEKSMILSVETAMQETPTIIDYKIKRLSECLVTIKEMLF